MELLYPVLLVLFALVIMRAIDRFFPGNTDRQLIGIVAKTRSVGVRTVLEQAYAAYVQKSGPQGIPAAHAVERAFREFRQARFCGLRYRAPDWVMEHVRKELDDDIRLTGGEL